MQSLSDTSVLCFFFFFNDTATTEIYTLSLHDALPILTRRLCSWMFSGYVLCMSPQRRMNFIWDRYAKKFIRRWGRSEEHTSELQSQSNLVCRLLLEKKKKERHHGKQQRNKSSDAICPV